MHKNQSWWWHVMQDMITALMILPVIAAILRIKLMRNRILSQNSVFTENDYCTYGISLTSNKHTVLDFRIFPKTDFVNKSSATSLRELWGDSVRCAVIQLPAVCGWSLSAAIICHLPKATALSLLSRGDSILIENGDCDCNKAAKNQWCKK